MSREYKHMLKALASFAAGFWSVSLTFILFSQLLPSSGSPIKTMFHSGVGVVVGCFLLAVLAVVCGLPFYFGSAIRYYTQKTRLNLKNYFKFSFVAGLASPFLIFTSANLTFLLKVKSGSVLFISVIIPLVICAEITIRLYIRNSKRNNFTSQD